MFLMIAKRSIPLKVLWSTLEDLHYSFLVEGAETLANEVLYWLVKKENGESKMCVLVSFDFGRGKTSVFKPGLVVDSAQGRNHGFLLSHLYQFYFFYKSK